MKFLNCSLAFGLALTMGSSVFALNIGDSIPDSVVNTKMKNAANGKYLTIKKVAGKKGTLVIFTCNSCPYVQKWNDRIVKIGNDYSARGIGVVAINSNDPKRTDPKEPDNDGYDAMNRLIKEKNMKYAYVVDDTSKVAHAFDAKKTPEVFLFDGKGKLVYEGAVDSSPEYPEKAKPWLRQALDEVLAGKTVNFTKGPAVGCGIKFRS